jgi:hypothetical protein
MNRLGLAGKLKAGEFEDAQSVVCPSTGNEGVSPMLLEGWLSAIRQHCSRPFRQSGDDEVVEIRRLLQELLDLERPTEKAPAEVSVDLRHGRLHR